MNTLNIIVKVLEGISYICSVALLAVAILGLRQFSLSKKTLKLNSKRDALKITTEQITLFFSEILDYYEQQIIDSEALNTIRSIYLTKEDTPDWKKISSEKANMKLKSKVSKEKYMVLMRRAFNPKRAAFNRLEAFSSTFTSGLGDEKTAYLAVGKTYCSLIEDFVNVLKIFNTNGYYKNTITLYKLWNLRLKKEQIETQMKLVDIEINSVESQTKEHRENLERLKKEISEIEDREITSIGVED